MLTQTSTKKHNWLLSLLKLIFALAIFTMHTFNKYVGNWTLNYALFTEGFFIISGIFLFQSATTHPQNTFKYIYKKWWKCFWPVLIGATITFICLIVQACTSNTLTWQRFGWITLGYISDIFPVQYATLNYGTFWYMFVLYWVSLMLYPLVKKIPKQMTWISLVVGVGLYIYMIASWGYVEKSWHLISNVWLNQFSIILRGFAPICLGIFIGGIFRYTNKIKIKKSWQIIMSIVVVLLTIATFVIGVFFYHTRFDFLQVLCLLIVCFIAYNQYSYLNSKYDLSTAGNIFGGLSLYIFAIHDTKLLTLIFTNVALSFAAKASIFIILGLAIPVMFYVIVHFIKRQIITHQKSHKK